MYNSKSIIFSLILAVVIFFGAGSGGDTAKIPAGFPDSFIMFVKSDEGVKHMTRDEWIERIDASKAKGDQKPRPKTKADISVIGHSGNAAVVKVELYRDGKHTFTDFISLYKFDDGWKLVGKIYQRH